MPKKKKSEEERTRLEMPEQPIDRYRIEWWTVNTFHDCATVEAHHAIYHVNTKWTDLYPPSEGHRQGGVDFENHWQIFHDDRFAGRSSDGWREPWKDWLEGKSKDNAFFSRRDAVAFALKVNLSGVEYAEKKVRAHRVAIAAQRAELGITS